MTKNLSCSSHSKPGAGPFSGLSQLCLAPEARGMLGLEVSGFRRVALTQPTQSESKEIPGASRLVGS